MPRSYEISCISIQKELLHSVLKVGGLALCLLCHDGRVRVLSELGQFVNTQDSIDLFTAPFE